MAGTGSSLRALQGWCAKQCEGYPSITIRDLTTSFRSGLAFCAIIHRYRPDLIDFESLDPDNVLENNRIAFSVSETVLGIPALLEAEDMVMMDIPDRLSIITYLSQYYHYFKDKVPADEQNDSEENILSMGSPPRYRLTDPNRYAMFKPCPPPRPLAAKKHGSWSSSSLESSSDRVGSGRFSSTPPALDSPSNTPPLLGSPGTVTPCSTVCEDRSTTNTPAKQYEIKEVTEISDNSTTSSHYHTPPNTPPSAKERHLTTKDAEKVNRLDMLVPPPRHKHPPPRRKRRTESMTMLSIIQDRHAPPRRKQKRDSWHALLASSTESNIVEDSLSSLRPKPAHVTVPKTSLAMLGTKRAESTQRSSTDSVEKTSLSALNNPRARNSVQLPPRMDEAQTRQEIENIINSIGSSCPGDITPRLVPSSKGTPSSSGNNSSNNTPRGSSTCAQGPSEDVALNSASSYSAVAALSNLGESTDQLSMTLGPGSVTKRDRVTESHLALKLHECLLESKETVSFLRLHRTKYTNPICSAKRPRSPPQSPVKPKNKVEDNVSDPVRGYMKPKIYTESDVGKKLNRGYDPDGGSSTGTLCYICSSHVFLLERVVARKRLFHRACFVCNGCGSKLLLGLYEVYNKDSMFYCKSCFKKIKLREGVQSEEYREAMGCPVTDPEELWALPSAPQYSERALSNKSLSPLSERNDSEKHRVRPLKPCLEIISEKSEKVPKCQLVKSETPCHEKLSENASAGKVRFDIDSSGEGYNTEDEFDEQDERVRRSSDGKRSVTDDEEYYSMPITDDITDDTTSTDGTYSKPSTNLRPRSLSVGADTSTKHRELKLDSSQRKRKSFKNFKLLSPILKRNKRNALNGSSTEDIDKALKEEEETLIVKKTKYEKEMEENEYQQKEMELQGQGLEMKLRNQGEEDYDEEILYDWFELVNRKNRLNHLESVLVLSIREIDINLQQKGLERQLRELHSVRKKYKERYIKEQETILVTELLQLIEERNYLVNLEETQRLTANEVDRQFREVMSATAGIVV